MGAGASAGIAAALQKSSADELGAVLKSLSAEDSAKVASALARHETVNWGSEFDAGDVEAADKLDKSSINRSNIKFSRLSMKIAKHLCSASPKLEDLEKKYTELAAAWKSDSKPPFCCVEGVKYAIDVVKLMAIKDEGH